jgi:hypothetical protein
MQAGRVTASAGTALTTERVSAVMDDLNLVASNKPIIHAQTAQGTDFPADATLNVFSSTTQQVILHNQNTKVQLFLAVVLAGNPSLITKCARPPMKLRLT